MSLAARCPACNTVFRVSPDQLKVSEGWVRCGRCAEVFNASENLIEIGIERQAPAAESVTQSARVMRELERLVGEPARRAPGDEDSPAPPSAIDTAPPQLAAPSPPLASPPSEADARAAVAATVAPVDLDIEPAFVRQARQAARWQHPGVRAAVGALSLVAAAVLVAQIGWAFRDMAVARWPGLADVGATLCGLAGCRIEAPRAIDLLVVDSSSLVAVPAEGVDRYRLALTVRNRGSYAVATPAADLALTDATGRLLARRVARPAELGIRAAQIGPGDELTLQTTLALAGPRVAGYTIEIFYP